MDNLSKLRARISDLAKEEIADTIKFRAEVLAHARRGDWCILNKLRQVEALTA